MILKLMVLEEKTNFSHLILAANIVLLKHSRAFNPMESGELGIADAVLGIQFHESINIYFNTDIEHMA